MSQPAAEPSRFGRLLRYWRDRRGVSQLELALKGAGSQRHISFLESGRSQPSREIVLRLSAALELPLRERNRLLDAAGFSPAFPQRPITAPELAPVRQALSFMLRALEPYPVIVVDRLWNLHEANPAATRVLGRFVRPHALTATRNADGRPNVMRLLVHPEGLRAHVANWREASAGLIMRLEREAAEFGEDADLRTLLCDVRAAVGPVAPLHAPADELAPIVPLVLADEGLRLDLFSCIAALGTAQDVTLQELRIETFFPADEATEQALRRLAVEPGG